MPTTYRELPRIPHYTLRNNIHQRVYIQIHQGIQTDDVLLLGEEHRAQESEDSAEHEDEAIAALAFGFRDERLFPLVLWLY